MKYEVTERAEILKEVEVKDCSYFRERFEFVLREGDTIIENRMSDKRCYGYGRKAS